MQLLIGWAAVASAAAALGWAWALHWRRSYLGALQLYRSLPKPPEKTPHQRGAETRKRRTVEAMRERRLAMERAIVMESARHG